MLEASHRLCSPGATPVVHTLVCSHKVADCEQSWAELSLGPMVVVWQGWHAGTTRPVSPGCTCFLTSLCHATNLHFHKLQALCVCASHHMWIHLFPFWEIADRNVVGILQKSTFTGWKKLPVSQTGWQIQAGAHTHPREWVSLSKATLCPANPGILQSYSAEPWL